jgi:hypothetical protein
MFYKSNIATDDAVHHVRMSIRAIIFNVIAYAIWRHVDRTGGLIETLTILPVVLIAALYVHLSGLVYSFVLAGKYKMYGWAAIVFVASAAPLTAIVFAYLGRASL